jgi:hypothetical protein
MEKLGPSDLLAFWRGRDLIALLGEKDFVVKLLVVSKEL